jgi:hypothetical protein
VLLACVALSAAAAEDAMQLQNGRITIHPASGWRRAAQESSAGEEWIRFYIALPAKQLGRGKSESGQSATLEFAALALQATQTPRAAFKTRAVAEHEKTHTPRGKNGPWSIYTDGIHTPQMVTRWHDACYRDESFVVLARLLFIKGPDVTPEAEKQLIVAFVEFLKTVEFKRRQ